VTTASPSKKGTRKGKVPDEKKVKKKKKAFEGELREGVKHLVAKNLRVETGTAGSKLVDVGRDSKYRRRYKLFFRERRGGTHLNQRKKTRNTRHPPESP